MSLLDTRFNESQFRFVKAAGDPRKFGFQVVRRLEKGHAAFTDTKILALNGKRLYSNPKADRQTYSGTFVSTKLNPEVDDQDAIEIEQTLTKVRDSVSDSNWQLVKITGDPAVNGSELVRATYYVNPYTADGVYRVLNKDTSFNSIKADNQTYNGKFANSKVLSQKENDETITILQTCKKVKPVGSADSLTNPLIEREENTFHPFGEGRGGDSRIIFRYPNLFSGSDTTCMAMKDSKLEAKAFPVNTPSWDIIDRKTEQMDDNTMTFYLLFRQVHRIHWKAPTKTTPHQRLTENTGRDNELRIKKWFGIDRNDHDSVVNTLKPANCDTGYAHLKLEFQDVDDGAKDYQWYQIFQSGDSRTDSGRINPFDFVSGGEQKKVSRNWNRLTSGLPSDASMKDTGWTFLGVETKEDGNGLITKEYQQGKVSWKTWGSPSVACDYKEYNNRNTDREERVKTWNGIRSADVATAMTAVAGDAGGAPADTNFHVVQGGVSNNRNGSVTITQVMVRKFDSKLSDSEVLNPHGLTYPGVARGNMKQVRWVYDNYSTSEIAALSPVAPPSGYGRVSMKTDGNAHGFFTRTYVYQKAAWSNTTPVSDTYAGTNLSGYGRTKSTLASQIPIASTPALLATITGDSVVSKSFRETEPGEGRIDVTVKNGARKVTITHRQFSHDGTSASVTKTWYGIKPGEIDSTFTAAQAYVGVSGTDTGFVKRECAKAVHEDGYAVISGTAEKRKYDSKTVDSQVLNPLGIGKGALQEVVWTYDDYTKAEIAALNAPTTPSGYKFVSMKTEGTNHGFFQRRYLFQKATWYNTTPTYDTQAGSNIGGYGKTKTVFASGVPVASAPLIVAAITGESCIDKSWREVEPGEAKIDLSYRNGVRKVTVTHKNAAINGNPASIEKTWYGIKPSQLDTTWTAAVGYAGETGYIHKAADRAVSGDGYATISGTASKDASGLTVPSDITHYHLYRSHLEKSFKKPLQGSPALVDTAADGFYWRTVREFIRCKVSATSTASFNFADSGLFGSFSKPYKNNTFYAERVDSRVFSSWSDSTMA